MAEAIRKDWEHELDALLRILRVLKPLDQDARERVLRVIAERLSSGPSTPSSNPTGGPRE